MPDRSALAGPLAVVPLKLHDSNPYRTALLLLLLLLLKASQQATGWLRLESASHLVGPSLHCLLLSHCLLLLH